MKQKLDLIIEADRVQDIKYVMKTKNYRNKPYFVKMAVNKYLQEVKK